MKIQYLDIIYQLLRVHKKKLLKSVCRGIFISIYFTANIMSSSLSRAPYKLYFLSLLGDIIKATVT